MTQQPGSIKIARIRGVDLRFHVSLIFLLVYVILVAALQFPMVVTGSGLAQESLRWGPWLSGFIFAVGLLLSVVAHEFGHVWVAQAQGIKVRGVTLMMLGGVSEMEQVSERPYAEFKLAVIGPVVSFILGAILIGIHSAHLGPELSLFSYWLGRANIVLGIFNLLPAFPLDGGRALRSLLSARMGKDSATHTSVKISKGMAWVLGILGFWSFNIILIFIAFFIYSAAQNELFMQMSQGILKGVQASEVLVRIDPIFESLSLKETATRMMSTKNRILPVQTTSGESALVSLESLKRIPHHIWHEVQVKEMMYLVSHPLELTESIDQRLTEIAASPLRALPVLDQGVIVGVVLYSDLAEMIQLRSLKSVSEDQAA